MRTNDYISVDALDPVTHFVTSDWLYAGELRPSIAGLVEGQLVRGTINPTVANAAGVNRVVWGGGYEGPSIAEIVTTTPPFGASIDTKVLPDGPYALRIRSYPMPTRDSSVWLNIDNTAPRGSAGPDQAVAPGQPAAFYAGAYDLNGIVARQGHVGRRLEHDGNGRRVLKPLTHRFAKTGPRTVTVAITDMAGNVTTDSAKVRVTTALGPSVGGKLPLAVTRGQNLRAKLDHQDGGRAAREGRLARQR